MIDAAKNKIRAPIFPLGLRTLALTSMGLGFLRPAPGTWGSMPPVALAFIMMLAGAGTGAITTALFVLLAVSCALCVWLGGYSEERFLRKDAGEVVIDETAGQCVPLLALPAIAADGWKGLFAAGGACAGAFVLFRFFDIVKPWPARRLESLHAGWGILMDDLVAGLYAAVVVWCATWLLG